MYFKFLPLLLLLTSCGTVTALKTGKGFNKETHAGEVDVLMIRPSQKFKELGVISVNGFAIDEVGIIHNALRDKAATLGADAVVITSQGRQYDGFFSGTTRWVDATAIKWVED